MSRPTTASDAMVTGPSLAATEPHVSLFSKALTPLIGSGFLTNEEFGRLVLMTSKELQSSAFMDTSNDPKECKEYFWKHVCILHWNKNFAIALQASKAPKTFEDCFREDYAWKQRCISHWNKADAVALQAAFAPVTFEECFRRFSPGNHQPTAPSTEARNNSPYAGPRPVKYAPEDYVIVVCFQGPANQNLCKAIKGQDIPGYFKGGLANVSFDQPIATDNLPEIYFAEDPVNLYIVRRVDWKTLAVSIFCEFREFGLQTDTGISITSSPVSGRVSPTSDYGVGLFRNSIRRGVIDGIDFTLELHDIRQRSEVVVEAHGLEFQIHWKINNSDALMSTYESIEENTGGLTAAHYLEALMDG